MEVNENKLVTDVWVFVVQSCNHMFQITFLKLHQSMCSLAVSPSIKILLCWEKDAEIAAEHEDYLVTFDLKNDPNHI